MIRRRSVLGLALLCAAALCAFAAPNASALKGTTAFTCVEGGGNKDFSDSHCDTKVPNGTGKFGHVEIAAEKATEVTTTGVGTQKLTTTSGGFGVEITCSAVTSTGNLENLTTPKTTGQMEAVGSLAKITYTGCTAVKPEKAGVELCKVKNGEIVAEASSKTYVKKVGEKEEMGVELSPGASGIFTQITLENNGANKCPILPGGVATAFPVKGAAVGTPVGSEGNGTVKFISGDGSLTFGGNAATLEGTVTSAMTGAGGNAISLTTTAQ